MVIREIRQTQRPAVDLKVVATKRGRQMINLNWSNEQRATGCFKVHIRGKNAIQLHPGRSTWTIIMEVWKIIFLSKWVICRFHVYLPGCIWGLFHKPWKFQNPLWNNPYFMVQKPTPHAENPPTQPANWCRCCALWQVYRCQSSAETLNVEGSTWWRFPCWSIG